MSDKYPEEEEKLILQLEKCADRGIKIFGYVIADEVRNSFNECAKIYRSKGGSFEIFDFMPKDEINNPMLHPLLMSPMFNPPGMMRMASAPMMNMMNMNMSNQMMAMSPPMEMHNSFQANVNRHFTGNAMNNISSILDKS